MKAALVGAELEENLGLRYMAAGLGGKGHQVELVPFHRESDIFSGYEDEFIGTALFN